MGRAGWFGFFCVYLGVGWLKLGEKSSFEDFFQSKRVGVIVVYVTSVRYGH